MAVNPLSKLDTPVIRDFLFRPLDLGSAAKDSHDKDDCLFLDIPAADQTRLTARIFEGNPEDPHILYLPAEYEHIESLALLGQGFKNLGFSFISLDYRGTGKSSGQLSMASLFQDAEVFYQGVKDWMKDSGRTGGLVIMGRSIGSAVALDLAVAHEKELLCLIMESAFNKTRDYLTRKGIDESLIPEGPIFQNRKKMSTFEKPVLFIHSPRDVIQTLTEVEWLVVESRSKATQFQIAPSGTREELAMHVGDVYLEFVHQYVNLRRGVRPKLRRRRKRRQEV